MLFNSYQYILLFLPISLIIYFILNYYRLVGASKFWLIVFSILFCTEVFYQMSESYQPGPEYSCGARWNDPAFKVKWPFPSCLISPNDSSYPGFQL
jgi:hypothetical protein